VCVRGLGIDSFQESSDKTTYSKEIGPCFEYRHSLLLVTDSTRIQLPDAEVQLIVPPSIQWTRWISGILVFEL